jgi:hypothetical protein
MQSKILEIFSDCHLYEAVRASLAAELCWTAGSDVITVSGSEIGHMHLLPIHHFCSTLFTFVKVHMP